MKIGLKLRRRVVGGIGLRSTGTWRVVGRRIRGCLIFGDKLFLKRLFRQLRWRGVRRMNCVDVE
jgi:hypothetical protein